jgi:hypothetical protein
MSLGTNVLQVTVSFFLSKEANASWETARIFCSSSKAMRQALMPYVLRQLCWPADILSKFTGELGRWRENVLYMVGYLGNFPVPALLQHLRFDHAFNQVIVPGELPATLTKLTFGARFNHPIGERVLPPLLTHLSFGSDFNQPLGERVLPEGLTHLAFGSVRGVTLQASFDSAFNHPISEHVLPPNLTQLALGPAYNHQIGERVLPPCLTQLRFGHAFNHNFGAGVLPTSLTELELGHNFNQQIHAEALPRSLKRLTLPRWMMRCSPLEWQDELADCGITMAYRNCAHCPSPDSFYTRGTLKCPALDCYACRRA